MCIFAISKEFKKEKRINKKMFEGIQSDYCKHFLFFICDMQLIDIFRLPMGIRFVKIVDVKIIIKKNVKRKLRAIGECQRKRYRK